MERPLNQLRHVSRSLLRWRFLTDWLLLDLAWWTRTFPIVPPRTVRPPVFPPKKVTTPLNRVSDGVTIGVSVGLFAVALIGGFAALFVFRQKQRI